MNWQRQCKMSCLLQKFVVELFDEKFQISNFQSQKFRLIIILSFSLFIRHIIIKLKSRTIVTCYIYVIIMNFHELIIVNFIISYFNFLFHKNYDIQQIKLQNKRGNLVAPITLSQLDQHTYALPLLAHAIHISENNSEIQTHLDTYADLENLSAAVKFRKPIRGGKLCSGSNSFIAFRIAITK